MTPTERAEKILLLCQLPATDSAYADSRNGLPLHLKRDIAAQIEEAEREAYQKGFFECHNLAIQSGAAANCEKHASMAKDIGRKEGWNAARENCCSECKGVLDARKQGL